ncbi:hypothetical protein GGH13_001531, partial [Coemansia sp. S155-1]
MHFDNARPHNRPMDMDPPEFHLLKAPPYSPDLAPCDFLFCPWMKSQMPKDVEPEDESVKSAWNKVVSRIPLEYYTTLVDEWLKQCRKVIAAEG